MMKKDGILRILYSKHGRILISILLGLGISSLFKRVCVGRGCIVLTAPNPNEIKTKIHKFGNKCYKYTPLETKCKNSYMSNKLNTAFDVDPEDM